MSGPTPASPRRNRKKNDRAELPLSFLPQGNSPARWAYIFALTGLVPIVGLVAGMLAVVFGFLGLRAANRKYKGIGSGRSVVSMVLGALETVANAIGIALIGSHFNWW